MYKKPKYTKTSINQNDTYRAERIELKIRRILHNGEPIDETAPLIYTNRKDGVKPEYDIRTDRFEKALEAMDKASANVRAYRENKGKVVEMEKKDEKKDAKKANEDFGGAEPIQGTDNK